MAISHVFAEGVGPFKSVHLDLRGTDGKPSLGPHILAGVNGSGKSTLLKAIAWTMVTGEHDGFPLREWEQHFRVDSEARVLWISRGLVTGTQFARAVARDQTDGWKERLSKWVKDCIEQVGLDPADLPMRDEVTPTLGSERQKFSSVRFSVPESFNAGSHYNVAAYSSVPVVSYLDRPEIGLPREATQANRFGFQSAVQNEAIQSWLLGQYSKRAIAKERHQSGSQYTASFEALERGLTRICGKEVSVVVDIEPTFQPRLRIGSQTLNFSQIPDGVRVTLGWLADFLMRADGRDWTPEAGTSRPGVLLFDEIEGFLHPLWQRRLLPALREALPATQSIVTSHSPFVISSCPGSIIHVLKLNSDGTAYAEAPIPAPVGESITSTLKDIFGVESRFDVKTEEQLAELNELKKIKVQRALNSAEDSKFQELYRILAARSEELRSLVTPTPEWSKSTVDNLAEAMGTRRAKKGSLVSR